MSIVQQLLTSEGVLGSIYPNLPVNTETHSVYKYIHQRKESELQDSGIRRFCEITAQQTKVDRSDQFYQL